jgi:hypothetical protein
MALNRHLKYIANQWNENRPFYLEAAFDPAFPNWNPNRYDCNYAHPYARIVIKEDHDTFVTPTTYGGYDAVTHAVAWSQADAGTIRRSNPAQRVYGWDCRIRNVHHVELSEAKLMYEFLSDIDKGLEKLNKKWGYVQSFGGYVTRVMDVLGIEAGVFRFDNDPLYDPNSTSYEPGSYRNGYKHHSYTPAEFGERINRAIEAWHESAIKMLGTIEEAA